MRRRLACAAPPAPPLPRHAAPQMCSVERDLPCLSRCPAWVTAPPQRQTDWVRRAVVGSTWRAPGAVCGDRSAGPSAARAAIAMPSVTISVFCADTVACHMQQLGALRVRWVPPGVASSSPDCPPDCSIRNSQACSKAQPSLLSPSPDDRSHRSQRGDCQTARRLAPARLPSEHCRRRHSSSMHGLTALARHVHRGRAIALGRRTSIRATPSRHAFDPAVQKGRAPPAAVRRGDAAVLGMYKRAQPRCISAN